MTLSRIPKSIKNLFFNIATLLKDLNALSGKDKRKLQYLKEYR